MAKEKVQNNVQAIQWPKEKVHSRLLVGFVLLDLQFYVYVLQIVVCSFVLFLLAIIVLSVLRFTDSHYPFGIFKLILIICQFCHIFFYQGCHQFMYHWLCVNIHNLKKLLFNLSHDFLKISISVYLYTRSIFKIHLCCKSIIFKEWRVIVHFVLLRSHKGQTIEYFVLQILYTDFFCYKINN